jgi:hypothetical protein
LLKIEKDGLPILPLNASNCEIGEKMENPDIADTYNTVLKMAKKRAYIDGILSATAASDIFTQDIEDFPEDARPAVIDADASPVATKPDVKTPEAVSAPIHTTPTANKPLNPISVAQSKRLYAIAKGNGYTDDDIKNYLLINQGVERSLDIERENYDAAVALFQVKKGANG